MTAPTPLSLLATLLVAVPFVASQALGAMVAVPVPVAGLPFYTVMSSELLQSFGVGGDAAPTAPAPPEEAQSEGVAPVPDAATAGARSAPEYAPQVRDLNEAWLDSSEHRRLRASLLRQKRAEYGYPPEGPAGSELLPEDAIPYPDRGAAQVAPLGPQADDEPAWQRRGGPRSGNGRRYRHPRRSGDAALPEDARGRGYLWRNRPPTEPDRAPVLSASSLCRTVSHGVYGPWPGSWKTGSSRVRRDRAISSVCGRARRDAGSALEGRSCRACRLVDCAAVLVATQTRKQSVSWCFAVLPRIGARSTTGRPGPRCSGSRDFTTGSCSLHRLHRGGTEGCDNVIML